MRGTRPHTRYDWPPGRKYYVVHANYVTDARHGPDIHRAFGPLSSRYRTKEMSGANERAALHDGEKTLRITSVLYKVIGESSG